MRLNKYLFNRVNNKERESGKRSVVWLKRGQPCLHHLHVLSTVFSWRQFSSFSLWIILLPPDSRCFFAVAVKPFFFLRFFGYAWILCNRCFFVIWVDNVGGTFVPAFGHGFCLGVLSDGSWLDSSTTAWLRCFSRNECGLAFTCLAVTRLSILAVQRSMSLAVWRSTSLAVRSSDSRA